MASSYASGFTFPHEIYETKESMVHKTIVFLAGGIAEELVFGEANATVGRSNDREQASMLVMDYIRRYGFDERYQTNYSLEYSHAMKKSATDKDVEKMMSNLVAETRQLLQQHSSFLLALSRELLRRGSLEAKDVAAVAADFDLVAAIREEGYIHLPDYGAKMEA